VGAISRFYTGRELQRLLHPRAPAPKNFHCTQPPLARRPSSYSPHLKCAGPPLSHQGGGA
jgi:hypothetical protein